MGNYTNITDFNGLDIHVFRYNRSEIGERFAVAKLAALSKPSSMLSYLQSESTVGPIYSHDLYRSVFLMKKTTVSPATPNMPIVFALSEDASYKMDVMRT
ncbi:hypothetical protein PRIPAC_94027 [Pristionchus pacificus]|uniref:Uncharacterized protein n=1 Tax=Pristionchus pacificus TaxID=54126 RepID=A0A2A6CH54_PRIPA|nr:hypothetical protein PRIPAC_94027 [Pristionchus pacificus]|eukprot:PDM77555.1 hypothetical protein PRIPAC_34422 [Pristionchus pacificus]